MRNGNFRLAARIRQNFCLNAHISRRLGLCINGPRARVYQRPNLRSRSGFLEYPCCRKRERGRKGGMHVVPTKAHVCGRRIMESGFACAHAYTCARRQIYTVVAGQWQIHITSYACTRTHTIAHSLAFTCTDVPLNSAARFMTANPEGLNRKILQS